MKTEILVAAFGLAGLGLSAPARIHQERALQGATENVGNGFEIRDILPRKKKPSPTPAPVNTPAPKPKTTSPKNTPTPPPPSKTTTPAAPTTKSTPTMTSRVSTSSSTVKSSSSSTSSTVSSSSSSIVSSSSSSSTVSSSSSSLVTSSSSSVSSSSSTASVSSSTSAGSSSSVASTASASASFSSGITSGTVTDSTSATLTSGSSSLSTGLTDVLSGSSSASITLTTSGTATASDGSSASISTGTGSLSSSASGSLTSSATDSLSTTLTDSTSLTGTATTTGTETGTATSTTSSSTSTETTVKLGHGWRTTTAEERKAAKSRKGSGGKSTDAYDSWAETDACSLFDDDDDSSNSTVKVRGLETRGKKKAPPADCPTDYKGYLDIQFPSGNGIFNPIPRNGALFYSNVNKEEHNWADASGRGFTFMKESMKPDTQDAEAALWIKKHKCCENFWGLVSQAWATMVEGDVHVLLPSTPWFAAGTKPVWPMRDGKNSIWQDYEYDTVLANPKACRIWRWNYDTKKADLIAVKAGATAIGCPDTYPADPQTPPAKPAGSH